jgi:hypothetical protein
MDMIIVTAVAGSRGKVLLPPASGRAARAAVQGFAQPPVLLGLDLSPGQPFIEDAPPWDCCDMPRD